MNLKSPLALLLGLSLLSSSAIAVADSTEVDVKKERANSININPIGAFVGSYNLNYERLMGSHGLLVEGSFSHQGSDDSSSTNGGVNLGYRWHWRGQQNSGFLGVTFGYAMGTGEGSIGDGTTTKTFDVDTRLLAATANIGKRWAWDNGLNVTFRIGAGYGNWDVSTDDDDPDAQQGVEAVDDLLTLLPIALDGELSLGYAF